MYQASIQSNDSFFGRDTFLNRPMQVTSVPAILYPYTLCEFLTRYHLEQYHTAFLDNGCSDNDLPLLMTFDDVALTEFALKIGMTPFHNIALRVSVHEFRKQIQTVDSNISVRAFFESLKIIINII